MNTYQVFNNIERYMQQDLIVQCFVWARNEGFKKFIKKIDATRLTSTKRGGGLN